MYHIIFTLSRYVFDDMCTSDLIICTLDNELSKLSNIYRTNYDINIYQAKVVFYISVE